MLLSVCDPANPLARRYDGIGSEKKLAANRVVFSGRDPSHVVVYVIGPHIKIPQGIVDLCLIGCDERGSPSSVESLGRKLLPAASANVLALRSH